MGHLEIRRPDGPDDVAAVAALVERVAAHDGHGPLGEPPSLDHAQDGRAGYAGLIAGQSGAASLSGYAQLTRAKDGWAAELVVAPEARDPDQGVGRDLLRTAVAVVAGEGGGHVRLWVAEASAEDDAVAEAAGWHRERELLQVRRPLPVGEPHNIAVRPFVPGQDEDAWLDVNNRAFAWHPEQGGWDRATLATREAEPWFDPAGFLLHERGGQLAGFCWTKVHADHDPPLGEIYVIAVDPQLAGHGLGRQLVLAGLEHLAGRGLRVGMLYVDGENLPARRLYDHMGFTLDHVDRAYTVDVAPRP